MSDRDSLTVAIVGTGEMGAAVGRRLHESGARVVTSVAGRSAESVARVRSAGLQIAEDDDSLVRGASFVLSIVPPGVAIEVAERLRGPIGRADEPPVFVECNAISPATCQHICGLLDGTTNFIDAGIIGGPPAAGTQDPAKGPRFYASGRDAYLLTPHELRSRHRGPRRSRRRRLGPEALVRRADQGLHCSVCDDARGSRARRT